MEPWPISYWALRRGDRFYRGCKFRHNGALAEGQQEEPCCWRTCADGHPFLAPLPSVRAGSTQPIRDDDLTRCALPSGAADSASERR